MKVWVRRESVENAVHSLPFLSWIRSFNEWVPGIMQDHTLIRGKYVKVYFRPFESYGKTEAIVLITSVNVDNKLCQSLIRGGMPITQYLQVKSIVRPSANPIFSTDVGI